MNTNGIRARPGNASDTEAFLEAGAAACREAAQRLSGWAESATRYFRERRPEDIAADATRLARQRPGQTLAVAAVLGVLVGSAIHSLARR